MKKLIQEQKKYFILSLIASIMFVVGIPLIPNCGALYSALVEKNK